MCESLVQALNFSLIREGTIVVCDVVEGGVLVIMCRCIVLQRVVKVILDDEHVSPLLELEGAEDEGTDKRDESAHQDAQFLHDRLPAHAGFD